MSPQLTPGDNEGDPFRVLHDVLGSNQSRTRERVRHCRQFGNIRRGSSQPIQPEFLSYIPNGDTEEVGENDKEPNLDHISIVDWGSPPLPVRPTLHADTTPNAPPSPPVSTEGNLSLPQSPEPLEEPKDPGISPTEPGVLVRLPGIEDCVRVANYWRIPVAHREVKLQLEEKQLAARFNPFDELVRDVTATPVERPPSPPPFVNLYPKDRRALIVDTTAKFITPLSLIPTERIWVQGGHLAAGRDTVESEGPLTGLCSAETGVVVGINGGLEKKQHQCGKPCQTADDPSHGGICESTEHHPGARVWVCDDHDKLGRQQATYDLRYLSTSLRHYACADCCRKIEDDETGQYLSGTGWHVFEVQGLPDACNPTVKPRPPSSTTASCSTPTGSPRASHAPFPAPPSEYGGRYLARSITRCACASKVADRRLCAPHRLEAVAQLHRWHPSAYATFFNAPAASHSRKDVAQRWAAGQPPVVGAVEAGCPLCPASRPGTPVDHFGFRGPLGREGQTVAWVCKACLGLVTGAVATRRWVEDRFEEDRWIDMGPITRDYPMHPSPDMESVKAQLP
ncbi:hypothetical protein PG996_009363 [Apiospora saccharicola]|uniref:Uncharacterized protein n=1 Tax=Apiospora saccharicola TaxID=335842 RepID=A0ABR1UNG4_9PEZI